MKASPDGGWRRRGSEPVLTVCFPIPKGRIPLSGMLISRLEDGDNIRNAFEISGKGML